MTPAVTLAVLVAAFCHASWNAIIRMPGDKIVSITLLVTAAGVLALPGLFFVPVLPAAAWPFLIASAIIHVGYNTFLALSYHHGELTKVYPLVRGSAPLTTLIVSLLFLDEAVDASEAAGIVVVAFGIMALALDRGWKALAASPHMLAYAAATSLCITLYTLSDGLGARAAGNAHHYVIWLFVLDMLPMLAVVLFIKGRQFIAAARTQLGGRAGRRRAFARRLLDRDLGVHGSAHPDRRGAARNQHPLRCPHRYDLARRESHPDPCRVHRHWCCAASRSCGFSFSRWSPGVRSCRGTRAASCASRRGTGD